ncbi:MAG: hypothetical protein FWF57_10330 [Defluviitaleaceae bacterium]|nr:hypothetical protein [Defluviitaleaceae bacterium]
MQQEEIKKLLQEYENENFSYKFIKKEGIKLFFENTGEDALAARNARELIKATEWGRILYFNAIAEK